MLSHFILIYSTTDTFCCKDEYHFDQHGTQVLRDRGQNPGHLWGEQKCETFQYLFLNLKPQPRAGKGANVSHYMGLMIRETTDVGTMAIGARDPSCGNEQVEGCDDWSNIARKININKNQAQNIFNKFQISRKFPWFPGKCVENFPFSGILVTPGNWTRKVECFLIAHVVLLTLKFFMFWKYTAN